jgi:hypothetical protein
MKNLLVLFVAVFFITSCATNEKTAQTAHAKKFDTLKGVMHDMNNIVFERYYNAIERDDLKIEYSKEMASVIRDLSSNIKKAQKRVDELKLTGDKKAEFLALSKELGSFAPKFDEIARTYNTKKIEPTMIQLIHVCNKCHVKVLQTGEIYEE